MTLPNFLLIGAPKAGTTSLNIALDQHPDVFMCPIKEVGFFWTYGRDIQLKGPGVEMARHRLVNDINRYQKLFGGVKDEKAIGEASVRYLHHSRTPQLVKQIIPEVRLIAVLRQPADRAFSSFLHSLRDGSEPCTDFAEAIAQEQQGLRAGWTYCNYLPAGFYYAALTRYLKYFDRDQMHISLFEDLRADSQGLMASIYRFLGVDDAFEADLSHHSNVSGVIRNPITRWLWAKSKHLRAAIRPLLSQRLRHSVFEWVIRDMDRPVISPELRAELTQIYRQDIDQLQDLLQRDLSAWLEPIS